MNSPSVVERLVTDNLKFVPYIIHKYYSNTGLEFDEMMGAGNLGLVKSANAWDEGRGIKFATLAYRVISNEISMLIRYKREKIEPFNLTSIDKEIGEGSDLHDILRDDGFEEASLYSLNNNFVVVTLLKKCTERERILVEMVLQGKLQREIAERLGCEQSNICRMLRKLKKYITERSDFG